MSLLRRITSLQIYRLVSTKVLVLVMPFCPLPIFFRKHWTDCEVCMVDLDFSAAFDRVSHKALIFELRQLDGGGTFLDIMLDFHQIDYRRWLLMASLMNVGMLFQGYCRKVCLAIYFYVVLP